MTRTVASWMQPALLAVAVSMSCTLPGARAATGSIGHGDCPALQTQLVGAWNSRDGDGAFETMEFSIDGRRRLFNSWLHERPEFNNAIWRLDGCHLSISRGADDASPFEYIASLRGEVLHLKDTGDRSVAAYVRIPGED